MAVRMTRDAANRLAECRIVHDLSRIELASKSGVSERTIFDIESLRRPYVYKSTLTRLCKCLGCALDKADCIGNACRDDCTIYRIAR